MVAVGSRRKEWFCFGGGLFFPRDTGFSFTSSKNKALLRTGFVTYITLWMHLATLNY